MGGVLVFVGRHGIIELDCGIIYSGKFFGKKEKKGIEFILIKPSEESGIIVYMPVAEIKILILETAESYTKEEIQEMCKEQV